MDDVANVLNYNTLNLQTRQLSSSSVNIGDSSSFNDWWAVPWPGDTTGNVFQIFLAVDTSNWTTPGGQMQQYQWDRSANSFTPINWGPTTGQQILQVRVATVAAALPDDPDKDQLPDSFVGSTIIYGTIANSTEIFAWVSGRGQYSVPIPMNVYSGIAVDPHFLWMYGPYGFACATHASVLGYINGTRTPIPLWLGNGQPNNIPNVLDLSSCEDGTLFVLGPNNQAVTSAYHIDFNAAGGDRHGSRYRQLGTRARRRRSGVPEAADFRLGAGPRSGDAAEPKSDFAETVLT